MKTKTKKKIFKSLIILLIIVLLPLGIIIREETKPINPKGNHGINKYGEGVCLDFSPRFPTDQRFEIVSKSGKLNFSVKDKDGNEYSYKAKRKLLFRERYVLIPEKEIEANGQECVISLGGDNYMPYKGWGTRVIRCEFRFEGDKKQRTGPPSSYNITIELAPIEEWEDSDE